MNKTYTHVRRLKQTHTDLVCVCVSLAETVGGVVLLAVLLLLLVVVVRGRGCSQDFLQTDSSPASLRLLTQLTPNSQPSVSVSVKAKPMKCL